MSLSVAMAGNLDRRRAHIGDRVGQLVQHLVVGAPGALEHGEGVVGAVDHVQRGAGAEPRADRW